ncbi:hypothetical protein HY230_03115 [Candidatus Acetothermia bacterium]|nr:hypothetical protein [Candidatus Acetothermia bacterium]
MPERKTHTKKKSRSALDEGLKQSLAEERAGKVVGPFTTADEAMEFLYAYQNFVVLLEKALREAAELGKRYDPQMLSWIIDLERPALEEKLKVLEHVKA